MKKLFSSLLVFSCLFSSSFAQQWVDMMQDPNANFYDIQAEFNSYWLNRPYEKGKGYKQFRRWEDFMAPRVYPSGDLKQAGRAYSEFIDFKENNPELFGPERAANWTAMGPTGAPIGGGAGRINFVRFDPTNPNRIFAGAPDGGLWVTTNGGTSWTSNTDQLAVIGCTDIAIDPTNTQIMYLATGDGDAADSYSIGVLKSTNGGATWNTTGLTWTVTQGRTISKLLINPTNTQMILAATSNGIYRTTDGGVNWTQVQTGSYKDMEYKPGDPTTVYAAGTTFRKSTNSGQTWTQITAGLPTTGVSRFAIAVTENDPTYVYILAARTSDQGFLGLYRSTDSGTNFTTRSTTPNVLGWNSNGGDAGGQGWYDLAIAASPTNRDVIIVGGVNIWRSTNGGTNWTINGHWTGSGAPYVHADIHDLIFLPGSGTTYYSGNDGGVARTTNSGGAWTDISANMQIAQQYRVGLSASNANLLLAGHQDNGTNRLNGSTWTEVYGGDGMDCMIDRTNNNVMYASYVYGEFKRSTNGGGTWSNIVTGLTGTAAWLAPIHQDPVTANTLYCGYSQVFRSTNQGTNWTAISAFTGSGTIVELDIAPSNNQVIYAARSNNLYKTTNGGTAWTTITAGLPVGSAAITYIEISPTDPNKVWVTFSGYSAANKVFYSANGGTSWTNISTGLPNLPVNCVVYQNGTDDGIYIGTDVGVYYRDNTSGGWLPYLTGLPNVVVRDLEIYYPTGKIRAATFGRGTWESDLNTPGATPPVADFTADRTNVCPGSTVNFTDLSSFTPTQWSWTFTGGTPATSTAQNPSVVYNTAGTYAVSLTATNANGSDTKTVNGYIVVSGTQALPLVEGFQAGFVPTNWFNFDANADAVRWEHNTTLGGFGTSSSCTWFDNYSLDVSGSRDELHTPKYNFAGYSSATMTFDVAYARYSATYSDTLAVLVSTDCGVTFTQVFLKGGTTLSTNGGANVQPGMFIPTAAQWRTETVDMTPYVGQTNVLVKFQNRGRYGQPIYLDNINITGITATLPVASFTANPTSICAGQSVTYTNTSTGATSYSWSFPGGTPATSTAANPVVVYNTAGTYSVTLTATNVNGNDVSTQNNLITVNPVPATPMATSNSPICAGATLNLSTPTVTGATYAWTGPGGYTANTRTPSRTNATTAMIGTYSVTVTVGGCTSAAGTVNVTVNPIPATPTASSNSPVCAGATINLTTPTVTGATYAWTGPGGYTANTQNPTRPSSTTAMSGTYSVTVTVGGCTSAAGTVNVTVNPIPATPTASSNSPVCAGATINLTTPTITGATYAWTGPGGYTANTQNPTRPSSTTAMSGTYSVTVTVGGCTSLPGTTAVTVNPTPATPTATSNSPICAGATINLTTPTVTGATYAWTGPGGYTSTAQNPTRPTSTTAMSGTYSVTVTVAGCTSTAGTTAVTVNPIPATPTATANSPVCAGATINLSTPTVTGATYAWTGPGGYTANTRTPSRTNATTAMSGTYSVTVTVGGCTSAAGTVNVTVNPTPATPTATSNSPICAGATLNLSTPTVTGATYAWTGPGGYTANTRTPSRTNATTAMSGTYSVTVTVGGCTSAAGTVNVTVNPIPATPSLSSNSPVCSGNTLSLTTPTVSGATYSWTGPSGYTSTSQNPNRPSSTTAMSGTYSATVTQNGCTSAAGTTTVTVNQTPATPTASSNSPVCEGDDIILSTATVAGVTYNWNDEGTFTSTQQNPVINNSNTGMSQNYSVTLTQNGCTSAAGTTIVLVNPNPVVNAGSDVTICTGNAVSLAASGSGNFLWTPAIGLSSATISNPTANPSSTTTYSVELTDANGCSAIDDITITVTTSLVADAGNNLSICEGQSVQLNGSGGVDYSWSPATNLSNTGIADPVANPSATTTYYLTVSSGSCSALDSIVITVHSNPTTPVINFNGTEFSTDPASTYQWFLNGNPISGANSSTYTPTVDGVYTVVVGDANGCENTAVDYNLNGLATLELNQLIQFDIHPNPTSGILNLQINLPETGNYKLEVLNAIGQVVALEEFNHLSGTTSSITMNLETLDRGIYVVRISKDKVFAAKRVIKI